MQVPRASAADKTVLRFIVASRLHWGFVALMCTGLAGCAALLVEAATQLAVTSVAVYGAAGVTAVAASAALSQQKAEKERCRELGIKGIAVAELQGVAIPIDEGEVEMYESALWRSELEFEVAVNALGYRSPAGPFIDVERREGASAAGTLVITERSVLLVPSSGIAGVRIPYTVVLHVEYDTDSPKPPSMSVKSLCGRLDVFRFMDRTAQHKLDREATTAAGTRLKMRVAAFQATAAKSAAEPR
jgi:hypothetical protein